MRQGLDEEVRRFRTRPLTGAYPYVWLDATYLKVREDHRVVSMAVVIAVEVNANGQREVLGLDVGPSEDGAFWLRFLRDLVARGLSGVRLVTSDAHEEAEGRHRGGPAWGQFGSAVASTSSGTPWRWYRKAPPNWWPPASGQSLPSQIRRVVVSSGGKWPTAFGRDFRAWRT